MPRVPTYDSPQVADQPLPAARQESVVSPELLSVGAKQTMQAGQAMETLGSNMLLAQYHQDKLANQLRVDDALNKAHEAAAKLQYDPTVGFTTQKGEAALNRSSGQPLYEEYGTKLKDTITQIAGTLANPQQQQMFAMKANDVLRNFQTSAMQHQDAEFKNYTLSVRDGTQRIAADTIAQGYTNPDATDSALDSMRAAITDQARLEGKSATWVQAQFQGKAGKAHLLAVQNALEAGNISIASDYLKKYAPNMEADSLVKARTLLDAKAGAVEADGVARGVVAAVTPRVAASDFTRAWNITTGAESGGRQFGSDGKPLTSPKGAVGVAQVMESTGPEAAQLAGLPWDRDRWQNDANYNQAIGQAYFKKQLQDFGGDLNKAWAAYNAGPTATRAAVDKAAKGDGNWLALLPQETRTYVTGNAAKFATGDGRPPMPTLMEVHDSVRAQMAGKPPERVKLALESATQQYDDLIKAKKQADEEATANGMRWLIQNNGRATDMPASLRANIPADKWDNVLNFGQRVAKGDDSTNSAVYLRLSDQKYLGSLNDNQFFQLRGELSEPDFKHFADERNKLRTGVVANAPGDLNSSAIKNALDQRLRELNIDPTPKDDGGNDAARIGAIRKFVDTQLLAMQRDAGKKFTDAETTAAIDKLTATSPELKGWFGTYHAPLLATKVGDIPSATRDAITAAYKKQGVESPTDAQLLGAFMHLSTRKK